MVLGSFVHGSSSSNLSPLAQPFTVNRFEPKPKPSSPPPAFAFDGYVHSHSSNRASISDSFPHSSLNIDSVQGYGYFHVQPVSPSGNHLPSLRPSSHVLSYEQQTKSVTSNAIEATPYYPQYSSPIHDYSTSIVKESGYGIQNSGMIAPLDESSQTDYVQNLTDFGHMAKWKDPWKDVDLSSSWKEPKGNAVSPYASSLHSAAPSKEGFMTFEKGPGAWHGKSGGSSARKFYTGLEGNNAEWVDAKDHKILESNSSVPPFNITETSVLIPPTIQEATYSHLNGPPFMQAWSPFNQQMSAYDITPIDSCTTDPTIFHPSVTRYPSLDHVYVPSASGFSSSLDKVVLKDSKFHDRPLNIWNNKESGGHVSVKIKAPSALPNANASKINNDTKKDGCISVKTSPGERAPSSDQKAISGHSNDSSKEEFELKLTPLKLPKTSTVASATDGPGESVHCSDALDQFSAVDSPCWKGASSRHSLFGYADPKSPSSLQKELEKCNDLNQHNQVITDNADVAKMVSSSKLFEIVNYHEAGSIDNQSSFSRKPPPVLSSPSAELKLKDANGKSVLGCLKVGCETGAQCSDGLLKLGTSFSVSDCPESNSGLETSNMMSPIQEEVVTSARQSMVETAFGEPSMDFNVVQGHSSDVCSHDKEHASNPSCSKCPVPNEVVRASRASDMSSKHSVPRPDVQMLVNTIHNLSELLLYSHCSNANAFKENDYEVVNLAINNLNRLLRQLSKSIPKCDSSCLRESTDLLPLKHDGLHLSKGTIAGRLPTTEVDADGVLSLRNHQSNLCKEEMRYHSCYFVEKDNTLGGVSVGGGLEFEKDVRLIKAVKKAMKQSVCEQEDNHPRTILYKDLWIEAEAALCFMKYELQLAHMEIEMEKSKQHQALDSHTSVCTPAKIINGKNQLSQSAAGGIAGNKASTSNVNKVPTENTPDISGSRNALDPSVSNLLDEDVEASVMSRFRVLKCWDGNLSSTNNDKMTKRKMPDSNFTGGSMLHGLVCLGYLDGNFDTGMKEKQIKAADPYSAEMKKLCPFIKNQVQVGNLEFQDRCGMLHFANYTGEIGSNFNVSETREMDRGTLAIGEESTTLSYISGRLGDGLPARRYNSSSSDWEHVLEQSGTGS